MNAHSKLAMIALLLSLAPVTAAAQPGHRRSAKQDQYDPFQVEDMAAARPARPRAGRPTRGETPPATPRRSGRYGEMLDAAGHGEPGSGDNHRRESAETFQPVSYEPEYIVEEVYDPIPAGGNAYCDSPACDGPACGDACGYSPRGWQPCWTAFGEYLLLRPRSLETVYAMEVDESNNSTVGNLPAGTVRDVDPGPASGFRAGLARHLGPCDRVEATFTHFESNDGDLIDSSPAGEAASRLQSLTIFQGAAEDWDSAAAHGEVDFQLLDFDYHRNLYGVDWFTGIRVAWLDQDFQAEFLEGSSDFRAGISDVDFHGAGIRFGLGKEHRDPRLGWLVYARGAGSFMGGQFDGSFMQTSGDELTDFSTSWSSGRLVTTFDLELGFGWEDPLGRYRFTAGYMLNYWFNVVTTGEYFNALQTGLYNSVDGSNIGFDGLAVRAELRF